MSDQAEGYDGATKVTVRLRLNPRAAQKFMDARVLLVKRDEKAVIARHTEQAKEVGRDAYRGGRTDVTGTKRPDSGTPLFGWAKEGEQGVSFSRLRKDLEENLGFRLVGANLMQKPGDTMYFLYLNFEHPERLTRTGQVITAPANALIDQALGRTYEHTHVFLNPDGGMTVNPSHAQDTSPQKLLRVDTAGLPKCEPVRR